MTEINNYPNYLIYTDGRVYSKYYKRFMKPQTDKDGYKYVGLYKDRKRSAYRIHRLIALQFIPNPENKPEVDHINTIVDDNRLENLQWVTQQENLDKRNLTTNTGYKYICLHNNIYEMASGIEGMMGEDNAQANYCRHSNTIQLFKSEIRDTKHVIQCLLHEYRHYLQSGTWFKRYYAMGYDYSNHPYEVAAKAEEKNYKKYMKEFGEAK